jgi:hypothetical protein
MIVGMRGGGGPFFSLSLIFERLVFRSMHDMMKQELSGTGALGIFYNPRAGTWKKVAFRGNNKFPFLKT